MARIYTGIGSRHTPAVILAEMRQLARELCADGWMLRSGRADGADWAFEEAALAARGATEIYLPWPGFGGRPGGIVFGNNAAAMEMAASVHPAWDRLSQGARKLHARNCAQILGRDLASPSAFVLAWTPDGCIDEASRTRNTGGTATAIVLASRHGIPVFNLQRGVASCRTALHELLSGAKAET